MARSVCGRLRDQMRELRAGIRAVIQRRFAEAAHAAAEVERQQELRVSAATGLQCAWRGFCARRVHGYAITLARERASVRVLDLRIARFQALWRGSRFRAARAAQWLRALHGVTQLQALVRGRSWRACFMVLRRTSRRLQRWWRFWRLRSPGLQLRRAERQLLAREQRRLELRGAAEAQALLQWQWAGAQGWAGPAAAAAAQSQSQPGAGVPTRQHMAVVPRPVEGLVFVPAPATTAPDGGSAAACAVDMDPEQLGLGGAAVTDIDAQSLPRLQLLDVDILRLSSPVDDDEGSDGEGDSGEGSLLRDGSATGSMKEQIPARDQASDFTGASRSSGRGRGDAPLAIGSVVLTLRDPEDGHEAGRFEGAAPAPHAASRASGASVTARSARSLAAPALAAPQRKSWVADTLRFAGRCGSGIDIAGLAVGARHTLAFKGGAGGSGGMASDAHVTAASGDTDSASTPLSQEHACYAWSSGDSDGGQPAAVDLPVPSHAWPVTSLLHGTNKPPFCTTGRTARAGREPLAPPASSSSASRSPRGTGAELQQLRSQRQMSGLPARFQVVQVAAGEEHSLALTRCGRVFAWGGNSRGQVGTACVPAALVGRQFSSPGAAAQQRFVSSPREVLSCRAAPITQVAAGGHHSLALNQRGQVFAWGLRAACGVSRSSAAEAVADGAAEGNADVASGVDVHTPTLVSGGGLRSAHVACVAAGLRTSFALTAEGAVLGWGVNGSDEYLQEHYGDRRGAAAEGGRHKHQQTGDALRSEGCIGVGILPALVPTVLQPTQVWPPLPQPLADARAAAAAVSPSFAAACYAAAAGAADSAAPEADATPEPRTHPRLAKVMMAQKRIDEQRGELLASLLARQAAGSEPSCPVARGRSESRSSSPALQRGGIRSRSSSPRRSTSPRGTPTAQPTTPQSPRYAAGAFAQRLAVGPRHVVVETRDGRLFAWGANKHGQCGSGSTQDLCLPTPVVQPWPASASRVRDLACGARATLAIVDGELWGWGASRLLPSPSPCSPSEHGGGAALSTGPGRALEPCVEPSPLVAACYQRASPAGAASAAAAPLCSPPLAPGLRVSSVPLLLHGRCRHPGVVPVRLHIASSTALSVATVELANMLWPPHCAAEMQRAVATAAASSGYCDATGRRLPRCSAAGAGTACLAGLFEEHREPPPRPTPRGMHSSPSHQYPLIIGLCDIPAPLPSPSFQRGADVGTPQPGSGATTSLPSGRAFTLLPPPPPPRYPPPTRTRQAGAFSPATLPPVPEDPEPTAAIITEQAGESADASAAAGGGDKPPSPIRSYSFRFSRSPGTANAAGVGAAPAPAEAFRPDAKSHSWSGAAQADVVVLSSASDGPRAGEDDAVAAALQRVLARADGAAARLRESACAVPGLPRGAVSVTLSEVTVGSMDRVRGTATAAAIGPAAPDTEPVNNAQSSSDGGDVVPSLGALGAPTRLTPTASASIGAASSGAGAMPQPDSRADHVPSIPTAVCAAMPVDALLAGVVDAHAAPVPGKWDREASQPSADAPMPAAQVPEPTPQARPPPPPRRAPSSGEVLHRLASSEARQA